MRAKAHRPASSKTRKLYFFLILIILLIVFIAVMRIPLLLAIGDFLILQDQLKPADIIHVISGPDYRTDHGIQLMKQGYAKEIFFTGSWCTEIQDVHATRGQQRALNQGISASAIVTDSTDVISTYEEASRLKELIDHSPIPVTSVIIVSDAFHMRRAKWTYRQVLGKDIEIQMSPVPLELTPFYRYWWRDWESRKMIREEYVKFAYYLVRYGLNWQPLSNWLATLDTE